MAVDPQLTQHRDAYRAAMAVMPGSQHISHGANLEAGWDTPEVKFPIVITLNLRGCPVCGELPEVVGLTTKCRDWHEVCNCGARYDGGAPRGEGCKRRTRPVSNLSIPIHPRPWKEES